VTFDRTAPRRFDLVVGADGLHSTVRRLAFGPEHDLVHHLGLYVATLPLGRPADRPDEVVLFNTPGRLASIHPGPRHRARRLHLPRPAIPDLDYRDTARHRQIVLDAYAGIGLGGPPTARRTARKADEFYFDAVSAVRLPAWSRGRITLVGDAASCVSLLGDGSSLAIAGAHTLAEALGAPTTPPTPCATTNADTASWSRRNSGTSAWRPPCSSPKPDSASARATSPPGCCGSGFDGFSPST
jgi:2-polyprenyl-6-methoxyphenol hydroxylase-like FAD-dependent oxidoreductase